MEFSIVPGLMDDKNKIHTIKGKKKLERVLQWYKDQWQGAYRVNNARIVGNRVCGEASKLDGSNLTEDDIRAFITDPDDDGNYPLYGKLVVPKLTHINAVKLKDINVVKLKDINVVKLKQLCKSKGLKGYSKLRKNQLINLLKELSLIHI